MPEPLVSLPEFVQDAHSTAGTLRGDQLQIAVLAGRQIFVNLKSTSNSPLYSLQKKDLRVSFVNSAATSLAEEVSDVPQLQFAPTVTLPFSSTIIPTFFLARNAGSSSIGLLQYPQQFILCSQYVEMTILLFRNITHAMPIFTSLFSAEFFKE